VICLLSEAWDNSHEARTEYRIAEDRGKPIFPVRLAPSTGRDVTSEWMRCDLFGDGPKAKVSVDEQTVEFLESGLRQLLLGLRATAIAPDTFVWPPPEDPHRAPYRGWQPLEAVDAAIYFGRDAQINEALSAVREIRASGESQVFAILGPSGVGKSSFLRAGLLPRLRREDTHFLTLEIVRPERAVLTGDRGLAQAIHNVRGRLGLLQPLLGEIRRGCLESDVQSLRIWLREAQEAASGRIVSSEYPGLPTLVLPIDQGEELFGIDALRAGSDEVSESSRFLSLLAQLVSNTQDDGPRLVRGCPGLRGI